MGDVITFIPFWGTDGKFLDAEFSMSSVFYKHVPVFYGLTPM